MLMNRLRCEEGENSFRVVNSFVTSSLLELITTFISFFLQIMMSSWSVFTTIFFKSSQNSSSNLSDKHTQKWPSSSIVYGISSIS